MRENIRVTVLTDALEVIYRKLIILLINFNTRHACSSCDLARRSSSMVRLDAVVVSIDSGCAIGVDCWDFFCGNSTIGADFCGVECAGILLIGDLAAVVSIGGGSGLAGESI